MKKALIFCGHRVPNAEPNAVRLINFALMLKELGYETTLYGVDNVEEVMGCEKGVQYVQWSQTPGQGIVLREKRKKEYFNHVKEVMSNTKDVSLVISVASVETSRGNTYIRDFCKKNNVTFVQSLVEWYQLEQFGGVKRLHRWLHNEYLMRFDFSKTKKIIAISSYLANYYIGKGCEAIVIPTMVDVEEYKDVFHSENQRITIVYAGSPRRKDCILNAIFALAKLKDDERVKFQFHIFGVSIKELADIGLKNDILNLLGDSFVVHGRIPYEDVKQHVANADYTILLRHNTLNANAGFSTKVGESMACGTPVIANLTSDLHLYVKDGETGIVCKDESVEACIDAYRKILTINLDDYNAMRVGAKKMAASGFNLKTHIRDLANLIGEKYE